MLFPGPGDPAQFFVGMYLVGVAATGMFTLAAHFRSFLPLGGLTLVPMGLWLLASGVPGLQLTGATTFLFVFIVFSNARRFERMTIDAIRLMRFVEHATLRDGLFEQRQQVLGIGGRGADGLVCVQGQRLLAAFGVAGSGKKRADQLAGSTQRG